MSDFDDLSLDSDEAPEPELPVSAEGSSINWEQEARKAFAARDKAKLELHRTKLEAKYGEDIVSKIHPSIPPKEWEQEAEKWKATLTEIKPTPPEQGESAAEAEPPVAERSDEERALAAVSGQAATPGVTTQAEQLSARELGDLMQRDPARAVRLMQAKYNATP